MSRKLAVGKTNITTEPGDVVATRHIVGYIQSTNGTSMQVRRAFANIAAGQTDAELLPAVADKSFRITSLAMLTGATATDVTFNSASTAISCTFANAANGGAVLPPNVDGWFQTLAINEALTVTTGIGSTTGILFNYIEVPSDAFDVL